MAWASITQLETHLGVSADDSMRTALAVANGWCARQRPDLDPAGRVPAEVSQAVVIYAGLLYREGMSPQGFATYQELGGTVDAADAMMNVYRLLGTRRPVAR